MYHLQHAMLLETPDEALVLLRKAEATQDNGMLLLQVRSKIIEFLKEKENDAIELAIKTLSEFTNPKEEEVKWIHLIRVIDSRFILGSINSALCG